MRAPFQLRDPGGEASFPRMDGACPQSQGSDRRGRSPDSFPVRPSGPRMHVLPGDPAGSDGRSPQLPLPRPRHTLTRGPRWPRRVCARRRSEPELRPREAPFLGPCPCSSMSAASTPRLPYTAQLRSTCPFLWALDPPGTPWDALGSVTGLSVLRRRPRLPDPRAGRSGPGARASPPLTAHPPHPRLILGGGKARLRRGATRQLWG